MYFSEFFIFGFCYWVSMYNVCQPRFKANGILTDVGSCLGGVVAEAVVGVNLWRSTLQCIILEAEINLVVVLNTYELSKPILLFKVRNEQPYRLRARLLYNAFSLTAKLNLFHR